MPLLRRLRDEDVPHVIELNHLNVELLAPMNADRLQDLVDVADRFDVVEVDEEFGGFVVTFTPGTSYDSENYRWFGDRFGDRFYYLDRIVLSDRFRRRGLGMFVYDEVETVAAAYDRLTLEVNLMPRNDVSLAFHTRRGFVEVGRLGDENKQLSLMEKRLR